MTHTAKHTPGPWFYNYDDYCIVNQAGVSVVNVHGTMGGSDTNADIALIAAAPAMYEALETVPLPKHNEAIGEFYTRFYAWYEGQRKQALAQAEGK